MVDPKVALQHICGSAQALSSARINLESQDLMSVRAIHACVHREFYITWMELIASAATKGVNGCTLSFVFPNPQDLEFDVLQAECVKEIESFFQDTGFRIMGFGGWKKSYVPKETKGSNKPPEISAQIQGLVFISWRIPVLE